MVLKKDKTIPTIKGFGKNKKVYVWCPFCEKEHIHAKEGFNKPMCDNINSPFRETGYFVVKYKIVIE